MTNNNWIEGQKDIVNDLVGWRNAEVLNERLENFISKLLAKKDQEHKAELEAIRAEIEDGRIQDSELEHFLTVVAHNDVIDDNILILDKHINK